MPIALVAIAVVTAAAAAVTDLRQRRIPNWLTGSASLIGLASHLWLGGWSDGLAAGLGLALGFGLLIPFYLVRGIGAGDVKLLAALGAIVGPAALLQVALYVALAGGLQAIVVLMRTGALGAVLGEVLAMRRPAIALRGAKAPYALAIAVGVACWLPAALSGQ